MTKTINLNPTCIVELSEKNHKITESKFNSIFMEAVEESLGSFESFDKQEVYFYLETAFKVSKREIPKKIEIFVSALEKIFGIGAKLIEIKIIEAIHKRVPDFMFTSRTKTVIFMDYVAALQSFLLHI